MDTLNIGNPTQTGSAVMNQSAGTVTAGTIKVGEAGSGTYNLTGGSVTLTGPMAVNGNGQLNVDGGTLSKDLAGYPNWSLDGGGTIAVKSGALQLTGAAVTNVLNLKTPMEISGGDVDIVAQFRIYDELKVVGDDASINIQWLGVHGSGNRLTFELGPTGVSTINVGSWMGLADARIVVDGSAYTGGEANLLLLDSTNLAGTADPANITITGFDNHYDVSVEQDESSGREWVRLIITRRGSMFRFAETGSASYRSSPSDLQFP